jgi:hypothetical protein
MSRERTIYRPFLPCSPPTIIAAHEDNRGSSMKDVTTEQNSQKVRETHNSYNEIDALQHFYKQIGIPAVAAAVRYQGDAKIRPTLG